MLLHQHQEVHSDSQARSQAFDATLGLGIAVAVCRALERRGVRYCHWKSNEHLKEGMLGITDLDVLVERGKSHELNLALYETGFRQFNAVATHGYPAVEDYLGMDPDTGKLIHLHLHYQLISGEPNLKGYRLPWEKQVLDRRIFDAKHQIYIVDPDMEMVLLITRAALKFRLRNRLFERLGKRYFSAERLLEYRWLQTRIQIPKTLALAETLLGPEVVEPLGRILTSAQPSLRQLLVFRRRAKPVLRVFRTFSWPTARLRRLVRELFWIGGGINKRFIHAPIPLRRVSVSGGYLVALMGCDGSGKSTHMKEIVKWLSWKVDVFPLYFGSGNGSSSLLRWPMKMVAKLTHRNARARDRRLKQAQPGAAPAQRQLSQLSTWQLLSKTVWALTLSLEKRRKLRQATAARNRGMLVICDRYPQNQVMGINEGPLLSDWLQHPSRLRRTLARWESTPYREAELYPPDIVIKLDISPELSMQRKSDMTLERCRRRADVIQRLGYPESTRTEIIDASQPLEWVQAEVKRCIWRAFS